MLLGDMALSGPAAADRLRAMGRVRFRFVSEHPNLLRLMLRGERLDAPRPALPAAMRDALDVLAVAVPASAATDAAKDAARAAASPDRIADITMA